jgi:small-conductance mechanosensitive channel
MENFNINPALVENIVYSAIVLIVAAVIVAILNRGVGILAKHLNMPTLACKPLRRIVRYAVILVAIGIVLRRFGFGDMDTVLKVVGTVLGLVAIGFVATWSILSHFLCTFVLILFKPFSIGDEIDIPGDAVNGKVVDITLIYTTLRTSTGEFVQVPNNVFLQKIFKRRVGANSVDLAHQLRQEKPVE